MPAKAITVGNLKGGVGKTTVSFLLCLAAVLDGKSVAALDLDASGGLSRNLGISPNNARYTALDVLVAEQVDITDALVPSSLTGGGIAYGLLHDSRLAQVGAINVFNLQKALDTLRDMVDYIIIDTQPEENAIVPPLLVADRIIIPSKTSINDIHVSTQTIRLIDSLDRLPSLAGLVFTEVQRNTSQKVKSTIEGFRGLGLILTNPENQHEIIIPAGKNWIIDRFNQAPTFTNSELALIHDLQQAAENYQSEQLAWETLLSVR